MGLSLGTWEVGSTVEHCRLHRSGGLASTTMKGKKGEKVSAGQAFVYGWTTVFGVMGFVRFLYTPPTAMMVMQSNIHSTSALSRL